MKKRALCIILAVLLLIICFMSGCSGETEPTETEPAATEKRDPAEDGALNILMIGNSFCYYYVEELYALLMESPLPGINEVYVYNLYYSGCRTDQHYNWWRNNQANYDYYCVSTNGRQEVKGYDKWTLENALLLADWDYISLQGIPNGSSYINDDPIELGNSNAMYVAPLLERIHTLFPHAQLLWHQTWFSEVGRVTSNNYIYTAEDGPKYDAGMKAVCEYMCGQFLEDKPYDMTLVRSGPAWTKARELNETANVLPYGGLCARLGKNSFGDGRDNSGDGYHDGDIGGAQLLNAYIWYMTITGDTDLTDSTYAPVYKQNGIEYLLTQEHIDLLKEAAMTSFAQP